MLVGTIMIGYGRRPRIVMLAKLQWDPLLEDIGSFGDLWSRIPFPGPIRSRYWRIPPCEIPKGEQELIDWLYAWWGRIDAWIGERRTGPMADVVSPSLRMD
jgi:hypothetical protein